MNERLQRTTMRATLFAAIVALMLAGCTTLPEPAAQGPTTPPAWKTAAPAQGWVSAEAATLWEQGHWWQLFGDPVLDELAQHLQWSNQTLAASVAEVARAQAMLREQRAAFWPTLGAQLSTQRSGGDDRDTVRSAALSLPASWSPDLWGRLRAATRAQQASVQASEADLAGARLSLLGSLAEAYFSLREADAELLLVDEVIEGYRRSAEITRNRYEAGIAARTDMLQAQTTLRNAQASRSALARSRAGFEHVIALLLGRAPAQFSLPAAQWTPGALPLVPVDVPAALLLRRPDVALAERAVAIANAQIGVARTAWFPDLTLNASVGAGAARFSDIVSAPNLVWSLGIALAQSVFDGGARDARLDQTLAAQDAAAARYRLAALSAMREVEDQLTAIVTLDEQLGHARASAEDAEAIEQQMMNRYESGLAAYTEVVTVQASALQARRTVLQLQLARQLATVGLIQALGGGWEAPWLAADGARR